MALEAADLPGEVIWEAFGAIWVFFSGLSVFIGIETPLTRKPNLLGFGGFFF